MSNKIFSAIMMSLLMLGTLGLVFNVQPVKAQGTIYIMPNGSIEGTTEIQTTDNVTYVFTANISGSIIVQRDNITIDGNGYTLQGTESGDGIDLSGRTNDTVQNTTIQAFGNGIRLESSSSARALFLDDSSSNSINGNNITNNLDGVLLDWSSSNSINGNNITANNHNGVVLDYSSSNSISGNNITNNINGVVLDWSDSNNISENSISENSVTRARALTANNSYGIFFDDFSSNNSIIGNNITNNVYGIWLETGSSNSISGNTFIDCGLYILGSSQNSVTLNMVNGKPLVYLEDVTNYSVGDAGQVTLVGCDGIRVEDLNLSMSTVGVQLIETNNSIISQNNITNNYYGIVLDSSFSNSIYHDNFVNNTNQASTLFSANVWDNGYPSGGNYWSDYNGTDLYSGQYQNVTGSDGIGDTPYTITANNTDNYPLMGTLYSFTIFAFSPESNMSLTIISNSSVTNPFFVYGIPPFWSVEGPELPLLVFSVNGGSGAVCFCRLIMPKAFFLNSSTYIVFVDAQPINATVLTPTLNSTQAYLYFTYTNSTHQVVVTVPEFSSFLALPLFMIATLLAVMVYKKKAVKTSQS